MEVLQVTMLTAPVCCLPRLGCFANSSMPNHFSSVIYIISDTAE